MLSRFDRYLLSQYLLLFGFFSLVLVGVYWINRAVSLFDQLIGDGQSALVFLEMTALTLPNVIRMVLPVSAFAASAYVTNRLSAESELVVMQATGFSAWRLARPVAVFGLIVAAMMIVLMNWLVPASRVALSERQAAIAENVTSRLLRPGVFQFPTDGITLYIRHITPEGELQDLFMSDAREPSSRTTYTAEKALLSPSATGPKLVLFDGMAQTLQSAGQRLAVTHFKSFTYDLASAISPGGVDGVTDAHLPTSMLIEASERTQQLTGRTEAQLRYEGYNRIAQPFLATVAALIGFSALLVGGFSRFGLWKQLAGGTLGLVCVQMIANSAESVGSRDPALWPLVWAGPLGGLALTIFLLWLSQRPQGLFPRRRSTRA